MDHLGYKPLDFFLFRNIHIIIFLLIQLLLMN